MHGDERILHDFLRGGDVTDEQGRQAHQRAVVRGVDEGDRPVGVPLGGDRIQRGIRHQRLGHVYGTRRDGVRFTCRHI